MSTFVGKNLVVVGMAIECFCFRCEIELRVLKMAVALIASETVEMNSAIVSSCDSRIGCNRTSANHTTVIFSHQH